MNLVDAKALLDQLGESTGRAQVEVGTRGRPPREYVYLKLMSLSDPDDYAVVSTRGDGWFELEVAAGYYTGQTSDLTPDDWVRGILEEYLIAAQAYLDGKWSSGRSRIFRIPFLLIHTEGGNLRLQKGKIEN